MISSLELAKICGVSQGTVDRALHGRSGISLKTKQKILEAASVHGYATNPAAREILTGKTKTVGAVVPRTTTPFFSDLFELIREKLGKLGLRMIWSVATDNCEAIEMILDFAARRARAVLIVPPEEALDVPVNITNALPVMSLINPSLGNVFNIYPDEYSTGRTGAEFLFRNGHSRIVFLSYKRKAAAIRDRMRGYESFMLEKGLIPSCILEDYEAGIMKAMKTGNAPTAIFCHNDWLALTTTRILSAMGVRVPDEISVLGIDNSPTFNALCPGITSIEYPYAEIAGKAAGIISGKRKEVGKFAPVRIIERQTVRKR